MKRIGRSGLKPCPRAGTAPVMCAAPAPVTSTAPAAAKKSRRVTTGRLPLEHAKVARKAHQRNRYDPAKRIAKQMGPGQLSAACSTFVQNWRGSFEIEGDVETRPSIDSTFESPSSNHCSNPLEVTP